MIRRITGKESIGTLKALARAGATCFQLDSGTCYTVTSLTPFQLKPLKDKSFQ